MKFLASKTMKQLKNVNVKSLLQNRVVLYLIALVAILDILYLANRKDFNSVIVFVIIGFLTSFFSKNMIIILLVAIVATHTIKRANCMLRKEGMTSKKDKEDENDETGDDETEDIEDNTIDDMATDASLENIEKDLKTIKSNTKGTKSIEDKKETYAKLKTDFEEFQDIQTNILGSMQQIEPLLLKAENFIEKFESYKKTGKV